MKQEIEILFSLSLGGRNRVTVPLGSITFVTRTVLEIFSEHSLGLGVCRALSFDREVLLRDFSPDLMVVRDLSSGWGVLRNLSPGWMVLRDLPSDWWDLRDLSTGMGVLGDHSLDLADPRDLSTGWVSWGPEMD